MTAEELLYLIGQVDDDLIQAAEDYRPASRRAVPWRALAGGLAAACLAAAVVLHPPGGGDSASVSTGGGASASAGAPAEGEAAGAQEAGPQNALDAGDGLLHTPEGAYRLTGEVCSTLPEDSVQLGVLFLEGEESESMLFTGRREYAGCLLWEGPDGTLYVQLAGGGYAQALPVEV